MTSPTEKSAQVLSSRATEKAKSTNTGAALASVSTVLASPAVSASVFTYLQPAQTVQERVQEVAIGEPIDLTIRLKQNEYVKKVEWQIPGKAVKGYWFNRDLAIVNPITKQDLKREKVRFYWLNDGVETKTVRARVTADKLVEDPSKTFPTVSQVEYEFVYPFEVKAPTLNWFKAKTLKTPEVYRLGKGGMEFNFGYTSKMGTNLEGIRWDWKVTLPEGHGGLVKDVQILLQRRRRTITKIGSDETEEEQHNHPDVHAGKRKPHWQLDMDLGDDLKGSDADPSEFETEVTYSSPRNYNPVAFPARVAGGASFRDDQTWDGPRTSFSITDSHISVDEPFKYFIMYKSDLPGAIWVSVAKAEWYWKGEVDRQGSRHILKQGSGGLSSRGAVTTEFPIYDTNVNRNTWDTVKR